MGQNMIQRKTQTVTNAPIGHSFLDWKYRLDRARYLGYESPQNYLQAEYLNEMPDILKRLQRQALDLLTYIWVTDTSDRSVDEKMTAYYLEAEQADKDVFYAWSEKARAKRDECDAGKISLDKFEAWLKQS